MDSAAARDWDALALSDLENLYGQIRFHEACRDRGVRPITGVELRDRFEIDDPFGRRLGRLILLARDRSGYETICRIVSRRRGVDLSGAREPADSRRPTAPAPPGTRTRAGPARRIGEDPVRSLAGDCDGVFVLTDDALTFERVLALPSLDPSAVNLLLTRPSDRSHEKMIMDAARRHAITPVADLDVVLASAADHALHLLQVAVRCGAEVDEIARTGLPESSQRVLRLAPAAADLFRDVPEALTEAEGIAEACQLDLLNGPRVLPDLRNEAGETPAAFLGRRCREQLASARHEGRYKGEEYESRLERELVVLERLGFSAYVAVVSEIVNAARRAEIQVAVRGSAVGSLVLHLLDVSPIDPVAHGLYFERFVHQDRTEPPDIDVDVCSSRREELIDWVFRRFGERVAMVSAHHSFRKRSAVRSGLAALGFAEAEIEGASDMLPHHDLDDPDAALESSSTVLPNQRLASALPLVERLVGKPRHLAVHPGGVVIANRRIDDCVPLERAPKGVVATQYDLASLEHTGLIKIDLLGNRCLSELQRTVQLASGSRADPSSGALERGALQAIPPDDEETLKAIDAGDTVGCFQLESPTVRSLLRRVPIRSLEDVIAALALVRPGPASGAAKAAYVRRAHGREAARALHPLLSRRLQETHGLPLYEEDIMYGLSAVAGVPIARADEWRTVLQASGEDSRVADALERDFTMHARRNGIGPVEARAVWRSVLRFVSYSFNKAHAASYAILAYRAAYLKTHFPAEFGCALLDHHGGMYPRRTIAAELRRRGVESLRPASTVPR